MTQTVRPIVDTDTVRLAGWTLAVALPSALAALVLGGEAEMVRAVIAIALCLTFSALTLELSLRSLSRSASWQLGAILGGSMARSLLCFGAGVALYLAIPVCHTLSFWGWLGGAYLLTLTLEIFLLLRRSRAIGVQTG